MQMHMQERYKVRHDKRQFELVSKSMKPFLKECDKQFLVAFYYSINNKAVVRDVISINEIGEWSTNTRELFRRALKYRASKIMVVLTHTEVKGMEVSQKFRVEPFPHERMFFDKLYVTAELLDIPIQCHVMYKDAVYIYAEKKQKNPASCAL